MFETADLFLSKLHQHKVGERALFSDVKVEQAKKPNGSLRCLIIVICTTTCCGEFITTHTDKNQRSL